jgi:hypothetical protein
MMKMNKLGLKYLRHIGAIATAALVYAQGCSLNNSVINYDIGLGKEITAQRIDNSCYIKCIGGTMHDYQGNLFNCRDLTFIVDGKDVKEFEEFECIEAPKVKVKKP